MREMHMFTSMMMGSRLGETTAFVTDGRFSGSTRGPCIGHVLPEAAEGGPIALVRDGDIITIDIPAKRIDLEVSESELERRRESWRPLKKEVKGMLRYYRKIAKSAELGAVWE